MLPQLHFESSYLPRVRRRPMKQPVKVRIMLPMSIRCNNCGNHICQGAKFNSRKEEVVGERYLGNQRFRFYFQCTECSAELAIKTQPQVPDCVVESGATRVVEDEKRRREAADELGDVMKPLQNSTSDSKREPDILPAPAPAPAPALDEIKSVKKGNFPEELSDKPAGSLSKATIGDVSKDIGNPVGSFDRSE